VTQNTKRLLVTQSKFETVGNHLIPSAQMTVIDCDDYNEASTKTGDVARWLGDCSRNTKQYSRENLQMARR
jgi:hypothetical protein